MDKLYDRQYASHREFMRVANQQLAHVLDRISPFFGLAHILDKDEVQARQQAELDEAVGVIARAFDPDTVHIDEGEARESYVHDIGVKAAGTDTFTRTNPLYSQGLPNIFVSRNEHKDNRLEVGLMYIPELEGWAEPISIPAPIHPSQDFFEMEDGSYSLGFDFPLHRSGDLDVLKLRQSERLVQVVKYVGSTICTDEMRPKLTVVSA